MLDLVSSGRADFGSGESSSEAELGGFQIDPLEKRAMWEEGLRVALRCLTETPFTGHAGDYVTMPPRNVVPKPVQKPHPPVWVACEPAGDDPPRRGERHRRAGVRVHQPRGSAALDQRLLHHARVRVRADRRRGEPERRVRHHLHVPRRRGRSDAARARGRELLRVLARALLRVRPPPARRDRRVGRVPSSAARERGYAPEAVEAAS